MDLPIEANALIGFLLALVRATAWLAIAPPFATKAIPSRAKVGLAAGLALAMAPKLDTTNVSLDFASFIYQLGFQVAIGLLLGFVTMMLFSAVQAAGSLIDLFGGFSLSQAFDPMLNIQTSIFGRFYNLIAITVLFAINGHLLLIRGFLRSFETMPLSGPSLEAIQKLLLRDLGLLFLSAIEIAAPLMAALFLADVVLGLLAKAAPQMNVLMLGFPFKILITLTLIGLAVPLLPDAVSSVISDILRTQDQLGDAAATAQVTP